MKANFLSGASRHSGGGKIFFRALRAIVVRAKCGGKIFDFVNWEVLLFVIIVVAAVLLVLVVCALATSKALESSTAGQCTISELVVVVLGGSGSCTESGPR